MELSISDSDARAIGLNSSIKERIVGLVHQHLGLASVVTVSFVDDFSGISLQTVRGTIVVDHELSKRIDN